MDLFWNPEFPKIHLIFDWTHNSASKFVFAITSQTTKTDPEAAPNRIHFFFSITLPDPPKATWFFLVPLFSLIFINPSLTVLDLLDTLSLSFIFLPSSWFSLLNLPVLNPSSVFNFAYVFFIILDTLWFSLILFTWLSLTLLDSYWFFLYFA